MQIVMDCFHTTSAIFCYVFGSLSLYLWNSTVRVGRVGDDNDSTPRILLLLVALLLRSWRLFVFWELDLLLFSRFLVFIKLVPLHVESDNAMG